jgi:hypothetical protein
MRSPLLALALVVLVGLGLIVHRGTTAQRSDWGSLHVPLSNAIGDLPPGDAACESPIWPDRPFSWVALKQGPTGGGEAVGPRPPLDVHVTDERSGRLLAMGMLAGDRAAAGLRQVELDARVGDAAPVRVCVENRGRSATFGGQRVPGDMFLELGEGQRRTRSLLATFPEALERAALFKLSWAGAWTYWVLLALLVAGVPAVLGRALLRALREDGAG